MNEENMDKSSKQESVKQWLKRYPMLVRIKRAWDTLLLDPDARYRETVNRLPLFAPNSAGSPHALAQLTFLSANQTFPFMVQFLNETRRGRLSDAIQAESFCHDEKSKSSASQLKHLFDNYGSDKASTHNYHHIYGTILKDVDSVTAVLEIGLGSNNEDVVSNMGRAGKPGASLRAFRDHLPKANIYGADVDERILFEEDRIKTFFVDQTDPSSFDALGRNVGQNFDLIIDDGLHSPNANIAVLTFSLKRLKHGGWVVVEDIVKRALPVWEVIAALLPPDYEPHLISGRAAMVFAVRRGAELGN